MCEECDEEPGERVMIDRGLYAAARQVEAGMEGDPAPDEAWAIFFGHSGGGIGWQHFQRMQASYAAAAKAARVLETSGRAMLRFPRRTDCMNSAAALQSRISAAAEHPARDGSAGA